VLPDLKAVELEQMSKLHVQMLMKKLETKSYSLSRAVRSYIRAIIEEAVDQGLMLKDPTRKVKILADKSKRCDRHMTAEELDLLLAELDTRDRLIVRVAVVCGLRPAELFGLKWDDFHPETGQLRIDETYGDGEWKPTKTKGSNGWVSMPPSLTKQLQMWREQNPDHTLIFSTTRKFDKPLDADDFVIRNLRRAAVAAGIMPPRPEGAKGRVADKKTAVNFQAFRRTCATWCLEQGNVKDAQTHLRHANPATTLTHYIQEIPSSVRRAVEGVDEHFFGNKKKPAPTTSLTVQ
jgi:integrase